MGLSRYNLTASARLVVFASGKNRAVPGRNLHTNFRLKASGGYLALVKPDGVTVASSFNYPAQFPDISYGIGLGPSLNQEVLWGGASMRYLVPRSAVSDAWCGGAPFDDSSWSEGGLPAGYNASAGPTTIAYSTPANTPGNQAYGGALGMDFTVTQPVQVTALGCFDDESNGISDGTTITVQLWARNNNGTPSNLQDDIGTAVLATTNFTSSSPGTLINGDRFKALAVPVVLTNGDYTIVAYGYNGTERNGNTAVTGNVDFPAPTLDTGGGALQFVGSRYGTAGILSANRGCRGRSVWGRHTGVPGPAGLGLHYQPHRDAEHQCQRFHPRSLHRAVEHALRHPDPQRQL